MGCCLAESGIMALKWSHDLLNRGNAGLFPLYMYDDFST